MTMTASMRPVGNQAKTVSIKPNRKRKIFDKVDAARREDRPAAGAGKGRWRRCYLCCPVAEEAAALSTLRRRLVPRGLTLPCAAVDLQSEVWRKSSRMTASSRRCTARGWTGGRGWQGSFAAALLPLLPCSQRSCGSGPHFGAADASEPHSALCSRRFTI